MICGVALLYKVALTEDPRRLARVHLARCRRRHARVARRLRGLCLLRVALLELQQDLRGTGVDRRGAALALAQHVGRADGLRGRRAARRSAEHNFDRGGERADGVVGLVAQIRWPFARPHPDGLCTARPRPADVRHGIVADHPRGQPPQWAREFSSRRAAHRSRSAGRAHPARAVVVGRLRARLRARRSRSALRAPRVARVAADRGASLRQVRAREAARGGRAQRRARVAPPDRPSPAVSLSGVVHRCVGDPLSRMGRTSRVCTATARCGGSTTRWSRSWCSARVARSCFARDSSGVCPSSGCQREQVLTTLS